MKFTYYNLAVIGLIFICTMELAFSRRMKRRRTFGDEIPTGEKPQLFDIHAYAKKHGENTLLEMTKDIFTAEKLIGPYSDGKIPEADLEKIIRKINRGYNSDEDRVYYHSSLHAADAMQTIYTYLRYIEGGKATKLKEITALKLPNLEVLNNNSPKLEITSTEKIAIYLTAAGHDYGHMGIENRCYQLLHKEDIEKYPFDEATKKDFSLEKFHAEQTIKILKDAGFFKNMKEGDYLKNLIKASIERTDGRYPHEKNLAKFKQGFEAKKLEQQERIDLFAFLVHAADVSNPSKPFETYMNWAEKVLMEFMRQGLIETEGKDHKIFQKLFNEYKTDKDGKVLKDKNDKPIPKYAGMHFPNEKSTVMGRQKGFIQFVLDAKGGFFETLESIFPSLGYFTQLARHNKDLLETNKDTSFKTGRNDLELIDEHKLKEGEYDKVPSLNEILEKIKSKQ